jgi:hypothetical protein
MTTLLSVFSQTLGTWISLLALKDISSLGCKRTAFSSPETTCGVSQTWFFSTVVYGLIFFLCNFLYTVSSYFIVSD